MSRFSFAPDNRVMLKLACTVKARCSLGGFQVLEFLAPDLLSNDPDGKCSCMTKSLWVVAKVS